MPAVSRPGELPEIADEVISTAGSSEGIGIGIGGGRGTLDEAIARD